MKTVRNAILEALDNFGLDGVPGFDKPGGSIELRLSPEDANYDVVITIENREKADDKVTYTGSDSFLTKEIL